LRDCIDSGSNNGEQESERPKECENSIFATLFGMGIAIPKNQNPIEIQEDKMLEQIKRRKHHVKIGKILVALGFFFYLSSVALGAPLPDFTVASADISFSTNNPVEGESVIITAYVFNKGSSTQADIEVHFFEGAPDNNGLEIGKGDIIIGLKSRQRDKVEAKWRAKTGSKNIYVVIDPDNAIAESDETNNQAFRAITGKALELPKPTQAEIEAAVQKGIKWLRSLQGKKLVVYCPDGDENSAFMLIGEICVFCGKSLKGRAVQTKDNENARGGWNTMIGPGATALVLTTLLHAGVPESDKAVADGIDYLLHHTPEDWNQWKESYHFAAAVLALTATGNKEKYLTRVTFATNRILSMQKHGGWGYGGFPDMAHMHYVLLALYAAQKWEIQIPKEALQQAADWAKSTQREDGGWGYGDTSIDSPWAVSSYGSMTTTALIVLKVCGIPTADPQFQKGLEWLKRHYTITSNPGAYDWGYYYLLALQRAMTIPPEQALIDERNWYEEGAAYLLSQQQPDGSWKGSEQEAALMATPFAILFLKKAIPF